MASDRLLFYSPPSWHTVRRLSSLPPRPGTIALTHPGGGVNQLLAHAGQVAHETPWVPLVICAAPSTWTELQILLPLCQGTTSLMPAFVPPRAGALPPPAELLQAVSARRPPSLRQMGAWCAQRLGAPELGGLLSQGMDPTLRGADPAEDRALRRALARAGLPNPLRLNRLGHLARASRQGRRLTEVSRSLGYAPDQVRTWLAQLVGCGPERWLAEPGWEWLLEEALRRRRTNTSARPVGVAAASRG